MGTISALDIADRAWTKALESTGGNAVRWTTQEAMWGLNDAQRAIVNLVPKAGTRRAIGTLTADTRQTLEGLGITDGISLVDVPRAYTSAGAVVRGVTKRDRVWFDEYSPTWHALIPPGDTEHWMFDERDPKAFYVYPTPVVGRQLEVIYVANPQDMQVLTDLIWLDDIYSVPMQSYLLFTFFSKDASHIKSVNMAAGYYQQFLQDLGFREQAILQNAAAADAKAAGSS